MQPEAMLRRLDGMPGKSSGWHGFRHRSVDVSSSPQVVTDPAAISALIAAWADAAGWIARESGVVILPGPDDLTLGGVLEAELGRPDDSLRVRRLGNGWVWTRYVEVPGGAMLSDDVVLVTTHGKGARYRRYWALHPTGAAEIGWHRLVGLENLE